jgi:hypothetical protein
MQPFLIACRLAPAPPGRLPPWGGLLDAADEEGLWSFSFGPEGVRPLPEGMLWGRFVDETAALRALDLALSGASELLGYPVRVRGRVACAAPSGGAVEQQIPIAGGRVVK